jgi:hypothetical protein
MDEFTITIRTGESSDFLMRVQLMQLPTLQLSKIKKLFRLMFRSFWLNREAIETVPLWLGHYLATTKEQWETASRGFQAGYRCIRRNDKSPVACQMRQENARLLKDVKETKAAYERAVKIQTYFYAEAEKE